MSTVQAVERAFAVLHALAGGPAGVTEIASRADLPKSTVARLLATLEGQGAVDRADAPGTYRIGSVVGQLAGVVRPDRTLVAAARPHLVDLAEATGEAAGLSVPDGHLVHYLDQVDSDHQVQVRDWTGARLAMHATSSGVVFLAFADERVLTERLAAPLQSFTPRTMTDPAVIRRRLAEVRATGYAWVIEEFDDGANSVAAPVRDTAGDVIAAVHSHGPAHRFPGTRAQAELGRLVLAAATRVERALRAA